MKVVKDLIKGFFKKQYIYRTEIDELLRMDIYEDGTPKPYYFHHNLIGSITGITDGQGNLIELVEYDPYGKAYFLKPTGNPDNPYELSETSTIGNNYLFQGREYDSETGLYYFRARYYDPFLSRFLSPDPLGYVDSMNLYQTFNDNPLNFVDPLGLDWAEYTGKVIVWYKGKPEDRTKPLEIYPATSGYRNKEYGVNYQLTSYTGLKGLGPIPEGRYRINLCPDPCRWAKFSKETGELYWDPKGGIQRIVYKVELESGRVVEQVGWGTIRAYLEPFSSNDMKGRFPEDRFYVHNSNKGYTHGCVETSTAFFNRLLILRLEHPEESYFYFRVKYSSTSTLGETEGAIYPPLVIIEEVRVEARREE